MKTYTGSLQRKGRRYYLVTTTNGRQKWFALRTDNLRLARIRATALAPSADADEIGWLRALVRIGEMAGIELQRRNSVRSRPSRALCAAFRAAGVMRIGNGRASFHSLRATFISLMEMDEAGVPPHITDAITGHAGGDMHARYTQPTPAAPYRAREAW